jgi:hypothetical protein
MGSAIAWAMVISWETERWPDFVDDGTRRLPDKVARASCGTVDKSVFLPAVRMYGRKFWFRV